MAALSFAEASLGILLSKPQKEFVLDLSDAPMTKVMEEYIKFKRKTRVNFRMSGVQHCIKEIEKSYGCTIMPCQLTDDFFATLQLVLRNKGMKPSSIKSYFGRMQAILQWGQIHGCRISPTFREWKVDEYRSKKIALSPDEVSYIYHFDVSVFKRKDLMRTMDIVRDMFVLSCNLGQRYSDMVRIEPTNFDAAHTTFTIVQQKTGNKAVVDLRKMTISPKVTHAILEKYGYTSPLTYSIGLYNRKLKMLLQKIGDTFNQDVTSEHKILGEVIKESAPRWKYVASHTARRTFVSYHIERHIPEPDIRKATGHKDSKSFVKYICEED